MRHNGEVIVEIYAPGGERQEAAFLIGVLYHHSAYLYGTVLHRAKQHLSDLNRFLAYLLEQGFHSGDVAVGHTAVDDAQYMHPLHVMTIQ